MLLTLKRAKESHSCTEEKPHLTLVKWTLDIPLKELQGLDQVLGNRNPNLVSPVTKEKIPLCFHMKQECGFAQSYLCSIPSPSLSLKENLSGPVGEGSLLHRNEIFIPNLLSSLLATSYMVARSANNQLFSVSLRVLSVWLGAGLSYARTSWRRGWHFSKSWPGQ